uniref:Uncharacterized protein n=1 Tax=Thermomicrobium roseum TaxID=500 RepID=A0A7C1WZH9_THERO
MTALTPGPLSRTVTTLTPWPPLPHGAGEGDHPHPRSPPLPHIAGEGVGGEGCDEGRGTGDRGNLSGDRGKSSMRERGSGAGGSAERGDYHSRPPLPQ